MIDLLEQRHSVRSFQIRELPADLVQKLRSDITFINTHQSGLNFQLSIGDGTPFDGFKRSYGMFRNVKNYLTAVIDPTFEFAEERAGYAAEEFVIELVKAGLGSCFVGATFSRKDVAARLEVYEKIPFLVAFGYPDIGKTSFLGKFTSAIAHRKQKDLDSFLIKDSRTSELKSKLNVDLELALRAVRCAPSYLNKQPVRLGLKEIDGVVRLYARVEDYAKNAVDLGIAKCNVALAISGEWEWGNEGIFIPSVEIE